MLKKPVSLKKVFPGEKVQGQNKSIGIYKNKSTVYGEVTQVGSYTFIHSSSGWYSPHTDDLVIGRVFYISPEYFKVDLKYSTGILPSLNFNNATKRNRPDISKGDWVYCRIVRSGSEPLLTCSGDGLGKLDGFVGGLPSYRCRELYMNDELSRLGKMHKYKIAVGLNGFCWVDSDDPTSIKEVYKSIKEGERHQ